ncbi:MAG: GDP-4-dehydro-6-deoxy-D-mannose reductase, partial [Actinomycetota bacterium]|nr:GDP-4-dehydro-6-deoxy-D-mannose reductase [Actinomycetota bacterium]
MRVLITGITGMAGSHLAEYCLARGDVEVVGTIRWRSPRENIAAIADKVRLVDADLRDQAGVRRLLEQVEPDA